MKDRETIHAELEHIRLRDRRKELRPRAVVEFARKNRRSALGRLYPRDDAAAANQYRLAWAREIIAVHVMTITPPGYGQETHVCVREYQSLSNHRGDHGGYLPVKVVMQDADKRRRLLLDTLTRFEAISEVHLFPKEMGELIRALRVVRSRYPEESQQRKDAA